MKKPLNEIRRMQRIAGIISESFYGYMSSGPGANVKPKIDKSTLGTPQELSFDGADGTLDIKLYKNGDYYGILEFCVGDRQKFCIRDSMNFLEKKFKAIKNTVEDFSQLTCAEIENKLYKMHLSGHVFDHHGGKSQSAFKCGDFSQGFGRQGY